MRLELKQIFLKIIYAYALHKQRQWILNAQQQHGYGFPVDFNFHTIWFLVVKW